MRRMHLAMALGLGLGWVAGCGPTASDPGDNAANPVPVAQPGEPGKAGGGGGGGGASGAGGAPSDVMKGMEGGAYRNMPGSQGPGEKPKADGAKDDTKKDDAPPKDDAKKDDAPAKDDTKKDDAPKGSPVTLSDDEIKNIEKLKDPEDVKLALAQKICLVNADNEHLGGMGVPVKQTVKGKTVFLCCEGCIDSLKADPDKYLAKLPK